MPCPSASCVAQETPYAQQEDFTMRDLTTTELGHIYGAGGCGCSPTPPSGGHGGSKSKAGSKAQTGSRAKGGSKAKGGSRAKAGSKGSYCG